MAGLFLSSSYYPEREEAHVKRKTLSQKFPEGSLDQSHQSRICPFSYADTRLSTLQLSSVARTSRDRLNAASPNIVSADANFYFGLSLSVPPSHPLRDAMYFLRFYVMPHVPTGHGDWPSGFSINE